MYSNINVSTLGYRKVTHIRNGYESKLGIPNIGCLVLHRKVCGPLGLWVLNFVTSYDQIAMNYTSITHKVTVVVG